MTLNPIWSGFHKKPLRERQAQLRLVYPSLFTKNEHIQLHSEPIQDGQDRSTSLPNWPFNGLDERLADFMVENCIG
jgi:hypothetical protein